MRNFLNIAICLLAVAMNVTADDNKQAECNEKLVDMADSYQFKKMYVDCADKPVDTYDAKSLSSFFGKKKAVDTYQNGGDGESVVDASLPQKPIASQKAPKSSGVDALTDNAGVVFNVREPFVVENGPQAALTGLFAQMAKYCPQGWEVLKEWTVPNQKGYYLHYQFKCHE